MTKQNTTSLAFISMPVPVESMPAHKIQNIYTLVYTYTCTLLASFLSLFGLILRLGRPNIT